MDFRWTLSLIYKDIKQNPPKQGRDHVTEVRASNFRAIILNKTGRSLTPSPVGRSLTTSPVSSSLPTQIASFNWLITLTFKIDELIASIIANTKGKPKKLVIFDVTIFFKFSSNRILVALIGGATPMFQTGLVWRPSVPHIHRQKWKFRISRLWHLSLQWSDSDSKIAP